MKNLDKIIKRQCSCEFDDREFSFAFNEQTNTDWNQFNNLYSTFFLPHFTIHLTQWWCDEMNGLFYFLATKQAVNMLTYYHLIKLLKGSNYHLIILSPITLLHFAVLVSTNQVLVQFVHHVVANGVCVLFGDGQVECRGLIRDYSLRKHLHAAAGTKADETIHWMRLKHSIKLRGTVKLGEN